MASLNRLPDRYPGLEALFRAPPLSLVDPAHRMLLLALIVSVLLHGTLMAMRFSAPDAGRRSAAPAPLEVVLVNARTVEAPVKADVRAQVNLDGGGNTDAKVRAKTPLPQSPTGVDTPDPSLAARARVAELEAETRRVLAQIKGAVPIENREASPGPQPDPQLQSPTAPSPSSADLAARSLEMARLRAELSRDFSAYQQRPRKAFVGARAAEYRFARYVEDWRAKIERVGNLNYPDEARRQKLYGTLVLTVSVRRDGSVDSIEVNRSSGFRLLDQAAIRIVELAAPFAVFPPDIAKEIDILAITRTWSFTTAEQFQSP